MFSRQLHVTPEALPEAQVGADRLLEPLCKGARASLQRLRENQGIAVNVDTESSEPAEETKSAFDNKKAPILDQRLSKDVTREMDTATPSKKIDNKYERVDVVKGRTRAEAEPRVLPAHLAGFVDVPIMRINRKSTTQSKMKEILCVDKRRNDLESHILSLPDESAMSGENGISSSSANLGRSVEHWRRLALLRSGDVEPNPGPPRARFWEGGVLLSADITAETAAKYRRAFDNFDIFLVVTRAVCHLHVDSSSLSILPRDTLTKLFLVLQEPWSLLCGDLFSLQFSSLRRFLIPVFISVLCGDCINPDYSQYHQSPVHPWTSSIPSPLSFSCRARGSRPVVLESPPSVDFDPDMPSQETVGACLLVLTHDTLESIIPVDLETPTFVPSTTRVFSTQLA